MLVAFFIHLNAKGQISNYVSNPGFEVTIPSATFSVYDAAKSWDATDTTKGAYYTVGLQPPLNNAPYCSFGFQYPRTGNNFIGTTFFCENCSRGNPRNRLRQTLKANTVYCAKYHVVNTNNSVVGMNSFAMFFANSNLDTISKCNGPLTYLNPQIQYQSNIITDTLQWTAITGTFTAFGDEKYMVLGNFKSNSSTGTVIINPTNLPSLVGDIYIDDVSLIEMDLPAFAGRDTFFIPGSPIFIGREPDVGLDEHCVWYKLPDMTTAIDTVAGLWVTPVGTTTYVVRQQLWCSGIKWDTVVVYESAVGIGKPSLDSAHDDPRLYPVPADEKLFIESSGLRSENFELRIGQIINSLGQVVKEIDLSSEDKRTQISIVDIPPGLYLFCVKSGTLGAACKQFVISR